MGEAAADKADQLGPDEGREAEQSGWDTGHQLAVDSNCQTLLPGEGNGHPPAINVRGCIT